MRTGSELIEHEPGDLTCVVEAGMRLSALQERLGRHGQMLALDPPGDPTIGECLAASLSGPRRHRYGAPRDLVIGMTIRLADGTIASSGGKVVKNVAGYDLGKLVCGARGAFGEIVRAALRLHPKPPAQATLVVPFETPEEGARLAQLVLCSQLVPSALDIVVAGPTQSRLRVALLFEGSARAVAAQLETARGLLGGGEEDASVWDDVAAQQLASGGRVPFGRLDVFLTDAPEAIVRVSALNAYVPETVPYAPSPLVERIRAGLAG